MTGHIRFDRAAMRLLLLDQRKLPLVEETFVCQTAEDLIYAIQAMVVRGAPAIGVAAAFGCVLAAHALRHKPCWRRKLENSLAAIRSARPTAVNLAWAVDRMANAGRDATDLDSLIDMWVEEALGIQAEDEAICRKLGDMGSQLLNDGDTVLTHCNAGALATAGWGTALGVVRSAVSSGKKISVIADETRPLLQGARLTAWELAKDGIPVRIACDNACALLLSRGYAQIVVTGADRIAANGDAANKIGTLGTAIIARHYGVPFYIAAPVSTIDINAASGQDIPIETRPDEEVLAFGGQRAAPENVAAYNFAFDVTPALLIDGIITEKGILRSPYGKAIRELFGRRG